VCLFCSGWQQQRDSLPAAHNQRMHPCGPQSCWAVPGAQHLQLLLASQLAASKHCSVLRFHCVPAVSQLPTCLPLACTFLPCSAGVLRVRSPEWGGSWVPLLDAASAKASTGSDVPLWPAWLEGGSLMAVVNSSKAPHPQVRLQYGPAAAARRKAAPPVLWR
jgi:hypothetical protein